MMVALGVLYYVYILHFAEHMLRPEDGMAAWIGAGETLQG